MNSEKISEADELRKAVARKAQKINDAHVQKANMIRARNRFSGLLIAAGVGGIYLYTLATVKQEKFLDQVFDEKDVKK